MEQLFLAFVALLPFAQFQKDVSKAVTYRSQVVWEEAERRGIEMEQLVFCGVHTELYRARRRGVWKYFQSLPIAPGRQSHVVDDKFRVKRLFEAAGISVPRALSVTRDRDARTMLQTLDGPVVVKPRFGSRGRHTTVHITSERDLTEAFQSAKKLCRHVVIEEYLAGSVCRATCVGGRLAGFFQAYPPRVIGDGVSSIRELVLRANATKPDRVLDIVLTEEHVHFLSRLGCTLDTVLPHGKVVALTHRTGRLFGGRTRELLGAEHPTLRAQVEKAAHVLGAPIVGFDLIVENPEADIVSQRWGIIEANGIPFIDIHYLPLSGKPSPVARAVWDYVESQAVDCY